MLNAVMLVLSPVRQLGQSDGQLFAIFIMALTSAEVSLALQWWCICTGDGRRWIRICQRDEG